MWYSNSDAIDALKLFIDAGEDLAGSLTYRYFSTLGSWTIHPFWEIALNSNILGIYYHLEQQISYSFIATYFYASSLFPLLKEFSQFYDFLNFYRYDLVDLARQVLSKLANQVYLDVLFAFQHKDAKALKSHSQKFEQLIIDIDELLAADDNFLLGTWLESANKLALTPQEKQQVRTKLYWSAFMHSFPPITFLCVVSVRVECTNSSNHVVWYDKNKPEPTSWLW